MLLTYSITYSIIYINIFAHIKPSQPPQSTKRLKSMNGMGKLIFPIKGECPVNSSETTERLTAEVFIPRKHATPTAVAKYLYSINAPAHNML